MFSCRRPKINPANLIKKGGRTSEIGQPIDTVLHIFAFKRLQKLFGQRFRGFVDYRRDDPYQMNKARKQKFERMNPSGWNCLNFLWIMDEARKVGHSALGYYRCLPGEIWIYDAAKYRSQPDDRYADQLWYYHGHANPNVEACYSQHFCIQPDTWSCAYHSLFAAVCILAGEEPENYQIDVLATFKMTKRLVEERFKNLKSLKIRDVLSRIATKKEILPQENPTWYPLDPSRDEKHTSPVEQKK